MTNKERIENANDFSIFLIKVLLGLGLIAGISYLIAEVSYWFALLIIPLAWVVGYFFSPLNGGKI